MNLVATGSSVAALQRTGEPAGLTRRAAAGQTPDNVAAARAAMEQFVGETFFGLMIKEMNKTVSHDHLLGGGAGEDTLRPYLNQQLAQDLARSRHFDLSDAMFETVYRNTPHSPVVSTVEEQP
jgi:Rod binding domain-containing protein